MTDEAKAVEIAEKMVANKNRQFLDTYWIPDFKDTFTLAKAFLALSEKCEKMQAVVEAAKLHADATIQYRLYRISESQLAGRYNALMASFKELEHGEADG